MSARSTPRAMQLHDNYHPNAHLIAALQSQSQSTVAHHLPITAPLPAPSPTPPEASMTMTMSVNDAAAAADSLQAAVLAQAYQSMLMSQFAQQQLRHQQQQQSLPAMQLMMAQMAAMSPAVMQSMMFPFTPRNLPTANMNSTADTGSSTHASTTASSTSTTTVNTVSNSVNDTIDFSVGVVRCICCSTDANQLMVRCSCCHVWQHAHCMGIHNNATLHSINNGEYCCELCLPDYPVHVERESRWRKQERQYRRQLKLSATHTNSGRRGGGSGGGGSRKKRKVTHGSLADLSNLLLQDAEMFNWHQKFKREIDDDLFLTTDSDTDDSDSGINDSSETIADSESTNNENSDGSSNSNATHTANVSEAELHAAAAISLLSPALSQAQLSKKRALTTAPASSRTKRFAFNNDTSANASTNNGSAFPLIPLPSPLLSTNRNAPISPISSKRAALIASLSSSAMTNDLSTSTIIPSNLSRSASPRSLMLPLAPPTR